MEPSPLPEPGKPEDAEKKRTTPSETRGTSWTPTWPEIAAVLEAVSDHVWIATSDLDRVLYSNRAYERIYGEPVQDLYADARAFLALLEPEDRDRLVAAASWPTPGPYEDEFDVHRRDGSTRRLRVRNFPVSDDDGNVVLLAGISEDITAEHALQAELEDVSHRLSDILESTSDAIVALDRDWRYTFANRHAGEMFGRDPAGMIGKHIWTEYPDGEHQPFAETYRRVMETGVAEFMEDYYEPWDRWFENRIFPTHSGIVILFHEITEQKRGAIAQREHLRMLEHANVVVTSVADNRIRFWNRGAEMLYGYAADEAVGQPMSELLHSELPAPYEDIVAHVRATGTWDGTVTNQTRDGRKITVASHWVLHRDADTGSELVVKVHNDITALIASQRESERLAGELHRSERLDSLGQLAGGIAHDFNNLLAVIINDLSFALDELPADAQARSDISSARRAAERAAALTRQLLLFARRDPGTPVDVDVDHLIRDLADMLERTVGSHIELRFDLDSAERVVRSDPSRLEQILLNLVINARDAMPRGGTIRVATTLVDVHDEREDVDPGSYLCLVVSDTGTGISEEDAQHAFEPFFTTKPAGQGTGLGLATVYGIATEAGGTAAISSRADHGTTVSVWLPCTAPSDAQSAEEASPKLATLLLVEDQEDLRRTTRRILEYGGYDVIEAADTAEALQLWSAHQHRIDAVIADVVVPGIPIAALADDLRQTRPSLPVVLVSGYTPDGVPELSAPVTFVAKPFTREELLGAVASLLPDDRIG